jgi:hypothetical protein
MNTMIPTELRFDLDLQDLPARATQVSSDALSKVSGGGGCRLVKTNELAIFYTPNRPLEPLCKKFCKNSTCGIHRIYGDGVYCGCWQN